MKKQKVFYMIGIVTFLFFSCTENHESIVGKWKVHSQFYKSTCRIYQQNGMLKGLALHYDDGTTKYKYDHNNPWYFFQHLKRKKNLYVDGVSGATKHTDTPNFSIEMSGTDTLLVTSYIMNRPINEIWTRVKTKDL